MTITSSQQFKALSNCGAINYPVTFLDHFFKIIKIHTAILNIFKILLTQIASISLTSYDIL